MSDKTVSPATPHSCQERAGISDCIQDGAVPLHTVSEDEIKVDLNDTGELLGSEVNSLDVSGATDDLLEVQDLVTVDEWTASKEFTNSQNSAIDQEAARKRSVTKQPDNSHEKLAEAMSGLVVDDKPTSPGISVVNKEELVKEQCLNMVCSDDEKLAKLSHNNSTSQCTDLNSHKSDSDDKKSSHESKDALISHKASAGNDPLNLLSNDHLHDHDGSFSTVPSVIDSSLEEGEIVNSLPAELCNGDVVTPLKHDDKSLQNRYWELNNLNKSGIESELKHLEAMTAKLKIDSTSTPATTRCVPFTEQLRTICQSSSSERTQKSTSSIHSSGGCRRLSSVKSPHGENSSMSSLGIMEGSYAGCCKHRDGNELGRADFVTLMTHD